MQPDDFTHRRVDLRDAVLRQEAREGLRQPQLAQEMLDKVHDPLGRPIRVISDAALAIANQLQPLASVLEALPTIQIDPQRTVGLHRFDPGHGSWKPAQSMADPGAYRVDHAGRRYLLRDRDGRCRQGSFALVKILAAAMKGLSLHRYDEASRCFYSQLGAEPPNLFERALVASSGLPPIIDGKSGTRYVNVAPSVAHLVISQLYAGF